MVGRVVDACRSRHQARQTIQAILFCIHIIGVDSDISVNKGISNVQSYLYDAVRRNAATAWLLSE